MATTANERATRVWCLAAVLLGGCASSGIRAAHEPGYPMKAPAPLQLDVLGGIPGGSDRESREADEKQAALRAAFEEARRAYEGGDYRTAAGRFLAAARQGRGEPGSYAERAIAENRASCYRNAARSWYMAGALDEGRALLEQAAHDDPSAKPEVRRILDLLGGK